MRNSRSVKPNGGLARHIIRPARCGSMPSRSDPRWMVPLPIRVGRARNSVMRIFEWAIVALILAATPGSQPARAFEGTPVGPQDTAIPVVAAQPNAAAALKKAVPPSATPTSLTSLQYAAEGGHPL